MYTETTVLPNWTPLLWPAHRGTFINSTKSEKDPAFRIPIMTLWKYDLNVTITDTPSKSWFCDIENCVPSGGRLRECPCLHKLMQQILQMWLGHKPVHAAPGEVLERGRLSPTLWGARERLWSQSKALSQGRRLSRTVPEQGTAHEAAFSQALHSVSTFPRVSVWTCSLSESPAETEMGQLLVLETNANLEYLYFGSD